jgi:hypothetical protein
MEPSQTSPIERNDTAAAPVNAAAVSSALPHPGPIPKGEGEKPAGFRDFILAVLWSLWMDVHVNASGLVFFCVILYGIIDPTAKDDCAQIAQMAGTYLFTSAKQK